MKPTIYDVAERANVSIATVSKIINNRGKISEKTKERVQDVMAELDYHPSILASALTNKKTATIGLLIPDVTNPYFGEASRRIEDYCRQEGYGVTICNTDNNDEKVLEYIEILSRKGVDGLIISSTVQNLKKRIQELYRRKMPLVLFSTAIDNMDVSAVTVTGYSGAFGAVEHLIEQGCKKIAFIGGEKWRSNARMRAYCDALEKHGLKIDERYIRYDDYTFEDAKKITGEMLDTVTDIDGIFAHNDMLAVGALKEVQARGIKVPEEIKIVGFDNSIFSQITTPELTTVSQPIQEMAQKAVAQLVEQIRNPNAIKEHVEIESKLIIRRSSQK